MDLPQKDEKMNRLNYMLLWVFMASLGLFAVVFSFYIASILIPILLVIVAVSGLANLVIYLYKNYTNKKVETCKINLRRGKKSQPDIIDVEYEIMDDKQK